MSIFVILTAVAMSTAFDGGRFTYSKPLACKPCMAFWFAFLISLIFYVDLLTLFGCASASFLLMIIFEKWVLEA